MHIKPVDIQVSIEERRVIFTWQDGLILDISHQQLRKICPCGFCRAKRMANKAIAIEDVVIVAMFDQGYGAQICFDDGHDKGLFPWVFLREVQKK
ncbi:MAG: gamma-butyrobetaine hydroxylase-like domain-containing protein [Acinetobacter sp.]